MEKRCRNCKYSDLNNDNMPCYACDDYNKHEFNNEIEQAKQEVASEIIDALIKTVDDNEFPCDTHDGIMWVVNSDFLTKFINDAKKKYIGE